MHKKYFLILIVLLISLFGCSKKKVKEFDYYDLDQFEGMTSNELIHYMEDFATSIDTYSCHTPNQDFNIDVWIYSELENERFIYEFVVADGIVINATLHKEDVNSNWFCKINYDHLLK